MPNFNNRPFYCVAEGDHIYTINRDLESLAQKADAEEEYKVAASPNFHLPDKPSEKSDFRVVEHIDELLEILREQGENEEEKELASVARAGERAKETKKVRILKMKMITYLTF